MLIFPSSSSGSSHDLAVPPVLLLKSARLADGRVTDVLTAEGAIVSVGADPAGYRAAAEVLNLRGYLLLPSLAEPHAHLDEAFTGMDSTGPGGPRHEAPGAGAAGLPGIPAATPVTRAWAAATRYLAHGTTAIRAHVHVGEEAGLRALEVMLDVRAGLAGVMDIQIVARSSVPVTGRAGATNRSLLRRALAAGADVVGGAPALDDNPGRAVEILAVVAADAGAGLDLHIDEATDPAESTLPRLIRVAEAGFGYPITASLVAGLGMRSAERRPAVIRSLAHAGIGVVTLPQASLARCGRGLGASALRGLTVMRELLEAGVPVAAGGGNMQTPVASVGRADPLEAASLLAVAAQLTPAEAFAAVSSASRQIMRLPEVTIAPGSPADLVAVRAADLGTAMATGTPDRIVLRAGQVVARARAAAGLARPALQARRPVWS